MLDFATLQRLCEPFGLPADRANFIARSQNDVFAFEDSILRVSHGRGQTLESIENELSWIDDLAARGLPVCRGRRSRSGQRCERVVSNVFVNGQTLSLFDFDNCEIGTVVQDLATVFYDAIYCHLLNRVPAAEVAPTYRHRCRVFLDAYRSVRSLAPLPTRRFQRFLILREGIIYAHYCRIFADKEIRPGFKQGMEQMRANVERGFTEAEFEDC
jgi:Ser/Thr protein kinase RdoA (MazF antagonist)